MIILFAFLRFENDKVSFNEIANHNEYLKYVKLKDSTEFIL